LDSSSNFILRLFYHETHERHEIFEKNIIYSSFIFFVLFVFFVVQYPYFNFNNDSEAIDQHGFHRTYFRRDLRDLQGFIFNRETHDRFYTPSPAVGKALSGSLRCRAFVVGTAHPTAG
jgi:hypothetical protein